MADPEAKHGTPPTAMGGITRLAYARAKAAEIDLDLLLKKSGLTLYQIENPDIRVKVRDQISFLNLTAEALQDDHLGFHLAQQSDLRELGLLYYVSASSEILDQALRRAARYSVIVNEGVCLTYTNDERICINFHYVGVSRHLDRHQIEFFMTTLVRMCRQLTDFRLVPMRIRLLHRGDDTSSELVEFYGRDIEFEAMADEIAFAKASKDMPVASADPYLNKALIAHFEKALSHRSANLYSFRSLVENAIVPLLPHGQARTGEVADKLGVGRRTFARRLSLEGVTFSGILESLRSDLAGHYLADKSLSISQIAWLLGYQEVSAFTHAFKRWTGKTPRQMRSQSSAGTRCRAFPYRDAPHE